MLAQGEATKRENENEERQDKDGDGGEAEKDESVCLLVEAVNRVAAEKKLSVDGLALYHLIAPMFPGQSFQVLRQRYLKYRTTVKSTVSDASPHRGEPSFLPLHGEGNNDEGQKSNAAKVIVRAGKDENQDRIEGGTGEGKREEEEHAADKAEQGPEEGKENAPNTVSQSLALIHDQELQVEPITAVTATALPTPSPMRSQDETSPEIGQASSPHDSPHQIDNISIAEAPSASAAHDDGLLVQEKQSINNKVRKRAQGNKEEKRKTKKKREHEEKRGASEKEGESEKERESEKEKENGATREKGQVIVGIDLQNRRHRTKASQHDFPQNKEAMISEIIAEMMHLHQLPREVVLYALLTHSGSIAEAHQYLTDGSRTARWDFRDDLKILEDGPTRPSRLRQRSPAEIASRRAFLTRLCDPPLPSSQ